MRLRNLCTAAIAVGMSVAAGRAEVRMPGMFSDNMVLQRDTAVPVWGWADPGEEVTVEFAGQKKTAKADETGKWMVRLDPMKASAEGGTLRVRGSGVGSQPPSLGSSGAPGESGAGEEKPESTTFRNVLVGEVWLCAGEANMDWPVRHCLTAKETVARADYPLIRLFRLAPRAAPLPMRDVQGRWAVCGPDTVGDFAGVAFFFGERLHRELGVPIGLIAAAWGSTRIESWTPPEAFKRSEQLRENATFVDKAMADYRQALKECDPGVFRQWADDVDTALAGNGDLPVFPALPPNEIYTAGHPRAPTCIFNGMIAPLVPYSLRGVIWYQGESNDGDGMLYRDRMEALIGGWRARWGSGEFPFYYVQLTPFYWKYGNFGLQGLWEAQRAALAIPNTGMAGAADISEPWASRPRNKFDVGNRLALWALHRDYGRKDLVYSGPLFKAVKIEGGKAIVSFEHAAGGLKSLDGKPLTYLVLAGDDREFWNADVEIAGDKLILSSKRVPAPVAVRFGWCQTAEPNLGNSVGLPAIAFRTDDWEDVLSTPRLGEWRHDGGEWNLEDGVYTQSDAHSWSKLFSGLQDWGNYTFELEVNRTGGSGAVFVYFRMDERGWYHWNLGGLSAQQTRIQATRGGKESEVVEREFLDNKWYKLKVTARDDTFELFVDGEPILTHKDDSENAHKTGGVGVGGWRSTARYRNLKLTDESGNTIFDVSRASAGGPQ